MRRRNSKAIWLWRQSRSLSRRNKRGKPEIIRRSRRNNKMIPFSSQIHRSLRLCRRSPTKVKLIEPGAAHWLLTSWQLRLSMAKYIFSTRPNQSPKPQQNLWLSSLDTVVKGMPWPGTTNRNLMSFQVPTTK